MSAATTVSTSRVPLSGFPTSGRMVPCRPSPEIVRGRTVFGIRANQERRPEMPDTRADLVARSADANESLANRINAVARVTSGQDGRLGKVLNPVSPSDLPPDAKAA